MEELKMKKGSVIEINKGKFLGELAEIKAILGEQARVILEDGSQKIYKLVDLKEA
jgi:transcription antitermination factor NusG